MIKASGMVFPNECCGMIVKQIPLSRGTRAGS
jgi:hypothetical protein